MGSIIVFVIINALILFLVGIFIIVRQIVKKRKYNKKYSSLLILGILLLVPFIFTSVGLAGISIKQHYTNNKGKGQIIVAIEKNDIEKVRKSLENNDINEVRKFIIDYHYNYLTPLAFACKKNNLEIAKFLIENGADVNKNIMYGEDDKYSSSTPSMITCENNNLEMLELLIENGADLNIKTRDESTFIIALEKGDVNLVDYLVTHGADTDIKGMMNTTSPIMTITKKNPDVELLRYIYDIKIDTDINCVDESGYNALAWALRRNCSQEYINELLRLGININQITKYDSSMLDIAYKSDNQYMIDYLVDKGIKKQK